MQRPGHLKMPGASEIEQITIRRVNLFGVVAAVSCGFAFMSAAGLPVLISILFTILTATLLALLLVIRKGKRSGIPAQPWVLSPQAAQRRIALTFDDGPHPETTPKVLDILDAEKVTATFFLVGKDVERFPQLAAEIARRGHSIGNHSCSHPVLSVCSAHRVEAELRRMQERIQNATGVTPKIFRPPYGAGAFSLGRALRALSLECVMWSFNPDEWFYTVDEIVDSITRSLTDGSVVLLHDGIEKSDILKRFLPIFLRLPIRGSAPTRKIIGTNAEPPRGRSSADHQNMKAAGYRLCTVEEMLTWLR